MGIQNKLNEHFRQNRLSNRQTHAAQRQDMQSNTQLNPGHSSQHKFQLYQSWAWTPPLSALLAENILKELEVGVDEIFNTYRHKALHPRWSSSAGTLEA